MQFDQQEHLSNIKTSNKGQQSCYDRLFVRCSFLRPVLPLIHVRNFARSNQNVTLLDIPVNI